MTRDKVPSVSPLWKEPDFVCLFVLYILTHDSISIRSGWAPSWPRYSPLWWARNLCSPACFVIFPQNFCSMKLRLEFLLTMKFVWKKAWQCCRTSRSRVLLCCVTISVRVYVRVRDVGSFRETCACFSLPSFLSPVAYLCRCFSWNRQGSESTAKTCRPKFSQEVRATSETHWQTAPPAGRNLQFCYSLSEIQSNAQNSSNDSQLYEAELKKQFTPKLLRDETAFTLPAEIWF